MAQTGIWQTELDQAVELFNNGKTVECEDACRRILSLQPAEPRALRLMGMLAQQAKRFEQAIECIMQSMEYDSQNADSWNILGQTLMEAGKLDQAGYAFVQAITVDPKHIPGHLSLGQFLLKTGKLVAAMQCYDAVLAMDISSREAIMGMGAVIWQLEMVVDMPTFDQQAEENSTDTFMSLLYGLKLYKETKFDRANRVLERVCAMGFPRERVELYVAILATKIGKSQEASEILSSATHRIAKEMIFGDQILSPMMLELNAKFITDWFVDVDHKLYRGAEARQKLGQKNDSRYISQDGVLQIDVQRWQEAQAYERTIWMRDGRDWKDDGNFRHCGHFDFYSSLEGKSFGKILEIGCGPFTNLRLILPRLKDVGEISLLDPLANDYLQHPHCTYRDGKLFDRPAKILAQPVESLTTNEKFDLIVIVNVLAHCYDVPHIFNMLPNLLADGGTIVFHDVGIPRELLNPAANYDAGHPISPADSYLRDFLMKNFTPTLWNHFRDLPWLNVWHYFIGTKS